MAMRCAFSLPSTSSICKYCYENEDGTATCCTGGVPKGDGITVSNSSHSGGDPNSHFATFQMFSQKGGK